MNFNIWLVVKDDGKRTFEVCGSATNDNAFTNKVYAMQRSGMNVSGVSLPITSKTASRDLVKVTGYTKEDGLYDRLQQELRERSRRDADFWEEEDQ